MTYWCQYIQPADARGLSSEEEISELIHLGLLKLHKSSGALVITRKGTLVLRDMLDGHLPMITQSYHADAIERRLRTTSLALTAYAAGLDVFTCSTEELLGDKKLFLTVYGRGRGYNPWGSTRIAAVAQMGDLLCGFHYIYADIGSLSLNDELKAFHNNTDSFCGKSIAFVFAGKSYKAILEELDRQSCPEKIGKLIPYREAYRSLCYPIHLLSCDKVGSMQLKIMSVPHYRMKLTKAALMEHYRPPPEEAPEWDAMFGPYPMILAADMNLRRVDAGIERAHACGYTGVALLALEEQSDAILFSLYREDGFTSVYCISEAALQRFAGGPMELHTAKPTQFLTSKGGVIDTPLIQSYRKAGG